MSDFRERGAVTVMVAVWMPVLVLFLSFVLDMGNWFEHKRHLQLQADAAAFAGGDNFTIPCTDTTNNQILSATQDYAGPTAEFPSATYNAQVGGTPTSKLHIRINSKHYWGQDSGAGDDTIEAPPCSSQMVDVKMTETDLPWYLKLANVPFINAHARVQLQQASQITGALPVSVANTAPKHVTATFFNENNHTVLPNGGPIDLTSAGSSQWTGTGPGVSINAAHVGVRMMISYGPSTNCGDPLVTCFDQTTTTDPLYIQGYDNTTAGAAGAPVVRSVQLVPSTGCGTAYFQSASVPCGQFTIQAKIDFGANPNPTGTVIAATAPGITNGNQVIGFTFNAGSGVWVSDPVSAPSGATGGIPFTLEWWNTTRSGTCSARNSACSLGVQQRAFAASDAGSGPIRSLIVREAGSPLTNIYGDNSFALNTSHDLTVTVGLTPNITEATSATSPLVNLRTTGSGSQTQALDCDPNQPNLKSEMLNGCAPSYEKNTNGTACPATAPALWASSTPANAGPYNCVPLQTGTDTNVVSALADRLNDTTVCNNPDRWASYWTSGTFNYDPTDPRIVTVFVVAPNSAIGGSGNAVIPIIDFATFYVEAWNGSGGTTDPCPNDPQTDANGNPLAKGEIVGRFMSRIDHLGGDTGNQPCDMSGGSLSPCVVQLTQ